MSFPSINFKKTNAEVEDRLLDLMEQKLRSLEKFIGEAPTICDVEFEKVTHHQSGNVHRVEVNLDLNGKLYRAEAVSDSFEKAMDEVRSELDNTLRSERGKSETLLKKGGRKLKELLRFGR